MAIPDRINFLQMDDMDVSRIKHTVTILRTTALTDFPSMKSSSENTLKAVTEQ